VKAGWQTVRLGDIAEVQSGGTPLISNKTFWNGDIPWYSSGELNGLYTVAPKRHISNTGLQASNAKIFPAGSLLIGMYDTAALKMSILDRASAFNQAIAGVRPNEKLDLAFVLHTINSIRDEVLGQRRGVRQKNLSLGKIRDITLTLPPLPEQQRIVALLDEAFDGIATAKANAEKNLQNAHAIFVSHLESVFTNHGEGWVKTTLGTELDLLTGFPFKSAQYTDSENDMRLLRGDNIVQGSLRWDDVKTWPFYDIGEFKRYSLGLGDVVLAMDRPWVKAGLKRAQITSEDLPCLLVQRTARLRGSGNLDNRFLFNLIGSTAFTQHILGVQTGIGVPHISGQQIKSFQFKKPPLYDQLRIADQLDSLREDTKSLEYLYQQKLTALDALKKSILHQAFSGQL
jgi:type I restriction enzyme S subunit